MNDYYYKMIRTYIPNHELCVLNKNTRYLLGHKKRQKHLHLYMNILLSCIYLISIARLDEGWILFEYYNPKGCVHLPVAYRRK